jgi:hypothetical protein
MADNNADNSTSFNRSRSVVLDYFSHSSVLVKKYLAIPATETTSVRVFSVAGLTASRTRTSLSPEHVDTLVFMHTNFELLNQQLNLNSFNLYQRRSWVFAAGGSRQSRRRRRREFESRRYPIGTPQIFSTNLYISQGSTLSSVGVRIPRPATPLTFILY